MSKKEVEKAYTIDYIKNGINPDDRLTMHSLMLDLAMMEIDSVDMNAGHYPYQIKGHVDNLNIDLRYRYRTSDETKIEIMLIHTNTENKEQDNEFHITLVSKAMCEGFVISLGERIKLCL